MPARKDPTEIGDSGNLACNGNAELGRSNGNAAEIVRFSLRTRQFLKYSGYLL